MIKDHTSIKNVSELKLGESRYVLFNGEIFKCSILEIKNDSTISIELRYRGSNFKTLVAKESIYREKPNA